MEEDKVGFRQTQIGEIPEDWEVVRLGDYCKVVTGGTPSTKHPEYFGGNIKWLKSGDIKGLYIDDTEEKITELGIENSNAKIYPAGSVAIALSGRGITRGKTVIIRNAMACSQSVAFMMPNSELTAEFLHYHLSNRYLEIRNLTGDKDRSGLNLSIVSDFQIPLPPLPEQRKIAEILSTADETIQRTNEIIAKMQELKKGLMQQLLTKGIGHTRFKQTEIGEIPEEWEIVELEQIMEEPLKNGINYSKSDFGFGTKFVNVLDIFCESLIDNEKLDRINVSQKEINNYGLKTGDILIVRSSLKREGVGYPALFQEDDEPVIFCGFIIRIRPNKDIIHPLYLLDYLRSPQARERLISKSGTVAITNVNQTNLKKLKLPLPNSKQEQQKIAEILSAVDEKIEIERKRKERLEELKKGLMQDLLTGKVRVKVN